MTDEEEMRAKVIVDWASDPVQVPPDRVVGAGYQPSHPWHDQNAIDHLAALREAIERIQRLLDAMEAGQWPRTRWMTGAEE